MKAIAETTAPFGSHALLAWPAKLMVSRLALLVCALLLAGCGGSEPPRPSAPPSQPGQPPGSFGAWLVVRRREGEAEIDARVLSANFEQDRGHRRLTQIIYRDEETGRKVTRSIKSVIALTPEGHGTIRGHASIGLFLLERAGAATAADREAAGLEAADAESVEDQEYCGEDETVMRGLRVPVWIIYRDRDSSVSQRQLTIVGVKVSQSEDDYPEAFLIHAYCHSARDARTFMVHRIVALAETEAALTECPVDDIDLWLRGHANQLSKEETAEIANPALRTERLQREAAEDAVRENRAALSTARAAALAAEAARRHAIVSGGEVAIIPVRVAVRTHRADRPEKVAVATGHILGFDTDSGGRATALFFAASANAKRGMALYLGETRSHQNRILAELRSPPDGDVVADVPAWVTSLPRDPDRLLPKHG